MPVDCFKKIGLIGGLSWASSAEYYRLLCSRALARSRNKTAGRFVIDSLDTIEIECAIENAEWNNISEMVERSFHQLVAHGCERIGIASNTIHFALDQSSSMVKSDIKLVRMDDAVLKKLLTMGVEKIGFIGTKASTANNYLNAALKRSEIDSISVSYLPNEIIEDLDSCIFNELCRGTVTETSCQVLEKALEYLFKKEKLELVVLGCTELRLATRSWMLDDKRILDTLSVHVDEILDYAA